jgi:hypothetical protein
MLGWMWLAVAAVSGVALSAGADGSLAGAMTDADVTVADRGVLLDGCHGSSCRPRRAPRSALCRWSVAHRDGDSAIGSEVEALGETIAVWLADPDDSSPDPEGERLEHLFSFPGSNKKTSHFVEDGTWRCRFLSGEDASDLLSDGASLTYEQTELSCAACPAANALAAATESNYSLTTIRMWSMGTLLMETCAMCRLDYDVVFHGPMRHRVGLFVLLLALVCFVGAVLWTMVSASYRRDVMRAQVGKKLDSLQQWVSEGRSERELHPSQGGLRRRRPALDAFDVGGCTTDFPTGASRRQTAYDAHDLTGWGDFGGHAMAVKIGPGEGSSNTGLSGSTYPIDAPR